MTSLEHLYLAIFCHSSPWILSSSVRLDVNQWLTAIFRSLKRYSIGSKSGLWRGHSSTFTKLSISHSWVVLAVCLGWSSHWKSKPSTQFEVLSALDQDISVFCCIQLSFYPDQFPMRWYYRYISSTQRTLWVFWVFICKLMCLFWGASSVESCSYGCLFVSSPISTHDLCSSSRVTIRFPVTSVMKAHLHQLLILAVWPALERLLVFPTFSHLRIMEASVLLAIFSAAECFCSLLQICALTQSCFWFDLMTSFLL